MKFVFFVLLCATVLAGLVRNRRKVKDNLPTGGTTVFAYKGVVSTEPPTQPVCYHLFEVVGPGWPRKHRVWNLPELKEGQRAGKLQYDNRFIVTNDGEAWLVG